MIRTNNEFNNSASYIPADWLKIPPEPIPFCVNSLIPHKAVTLITGHGGTGKSLLALTMAIKMILNIPIFGESSDCNRVAYMSLEDDKNIVRGRLYNIVKSLPEEMLTMISENLLFINRFGIRTSMVNSDKNIKDPSQSTFDLINLLKDNRINCLFVDTLVRTHNLNENDNSDMSLLLGIYERIAAEANCAVILIHHLSKNSENRTYAARGASAIIDNARSVLLLETVSTKEQCHFSDISTHEAISAGRLVRVSHMKHNYSNKHPEQYLLMSSDGIFNEIQLSTENNINNRINELYSWWETSWKCRPVTKTNIEDNILSIRPHGTSYGKRKYLDALDEAIRIGIAIMTDAPTNGSNNTRAKYYILRKPES